MALEKNLEKIEKLLSLMDSDTLTKENFFQAFEKVVGFVLKIQEQQGKAIDDLERTYAILLNKVQDDYSSRYSELKSKVNDLFVGDQLKRMEGETKANFEKRQQEINDIIDKKMGEVDNRVSKLKDGPQGLQGIPGPIGPMPTEHLELMKKVQIELKKVRDILSNVPRGKFMGRAKIPMPRAIDLTSNQNGSARVFTLPPDTVRVFGGISSQFPFAISSSDISRSGNTITLDSTIAPRETGQTLIIFTDALFYP